MRCPVLLIDLQCPKGPVSPKNMAQLSVASRVHQLIHTAVTHTAGHAARPVGDESLLYSSQVFCSMEPEVKCMSDCKLKIQWSELTIQ